MQDDLYFYVLLLGVILAGAALLSPGRKKQETEFDRNHINHEKPYRDLLQMMSGFKRDTEQQIQLLSNQILDLKTELSQMKLQAEKNGFHSSLDEKDALKLNFRYAEIFELKKAGKTLEEIAKQVDMGIGEIELILQLHAKSSLSEIQR